MKRPGLHFKGAQSHWARDAEQTQRSLVARVDKVKPPELLSASNWPGGSLVSSGSGSWYENGVKTANRSSIYVPPPGSVGWVVDRRNSGGSTIPVTIDRVRGIYRPSGGRNIVRDTSIFSSLPNQGTAIIPIAWEGAPSNVGVIAACRRAEGASGLRRGWRIEYVSSLNVLRARWWARAISSALNLDLPAPAEFTSGTIMFIGVIWSGVNVTLWYKDSLGLTSVSGVLPNTIGGTAIRVAANCDVLEAGVYAAPSEATIEMAILDTNLSLAALESLIDTSGADGAFNHPNRWCGYRPSISLLSQGDGVYAEVLNENGGTGDFWDATVTFNGNIPQSAGGLNVPLF